MEAKQKMTKIKEFLEPTPRPRPDGPTASSWYEVEVISVQQCQIAGAVFPCVALFWIKARTPNLRL